MDASRFVPAIGKLLAVALVSCAGCAVTPGPYYEYSYTHTKAEAVAHLASVGRADQPYAVGIAPALTRIFREGGPALDWTGVVTISAARGEIEHRELAIVPVQGNVDLTNVTLSVTPLTNSLGCELSDVRLGPMGYVSTESKIAKVEYDVPDVMMLGVNGFDCGANKLQSVIIAVEVAAGTASGVYTGQFTIQPAGMTAETFDVQVEVHDFELPSGPAMKTHISGGIRDLMFSHRVQSCWWDPPFSDLTNITAAQWEATAAAVASFFDTPGNKFMIIRTPGAYLNGGIVGGFFDKVERFDSYDANDVRHMQNYWAGMARILAEQDRLDQACLWVWDEPDADTLSKAAQACEWVHAADARLKTLCTDHRNNVRPLRLSGHVNIHVPQTNVFDPELDAVDQWGDGNEVWTYVTFLPKPPWPNVNTDCTCLDNRVLPWQIYQHRINGFLYWDSQVSFWQKLNTSAHPSTDFGSMRYAGDGTLVHTRAGEGWYPSLRLRNLADGMDDYLYIKILAELMACSDHMRPGIANTAEWQDARAAGQAALDLVPIVAGTTMSGETTDNTVLLDARNTIAQAIVDLKRLMDHVSYGKSNQPR